MTQHGPFRGKILCVTSNFPRWRGDSTTPFILHLAQDLQALGWQVDVLAPHAPGSAPRETLESVNVERFRYLWPARLETVCYGGGALINLRNKPLDKLKLPFLVIAQWLALLKRLRHSNYDLLHSHWILPQGLTGVLTAGCLGIPHVATVHGADVFSLKAKLFIYLKRYTLMRADAITVNSSATERAVTELAGKLTQVHRIAMGVSTTEATHGPTAAELRRDLLQSKGPLLIFVGRIIDEKGVEDLIHAVAILNSQLPELRTWIVGEGQDRAAMEALSRSLGLQDVIKFLGWVEANAVRVYLAAADIFVGPSRTARDGWVEAQGLTFLEAMAARIPVIATRTGGIADFVEHEQTGLLVAECSPNQIAAAVLRILGDPQLAQTLSNAGYERVSSLFSREATANKFSELYERVITRKLADTSRRTKILSFIRGKN